MLSPALAIGTTGLFRRLQEWPRQPFAPNCNSYPRLPCWLVLLVLWCGGQSAAKAFDPGSPEFFEQKIRPVLVQHCYECHSDQADAVGGSLWLDSAGGMREGGDSGPAVEPGDAEASVLISAIRYESSEMPPKQRLPDHIVDDFVKWIDAGAIDPRTNPPVKTTHGDSIDLNAGRKFWSFQPITDVRHAWTPQQRQAAGDRLIDEMVNQKLSAEGIPANPAAPPNTRLRRLAFDLTGLPPSEALRQTWNADPSDENWQRVVDQLLNSRAFAQHWARHWMDIARYADSNGSDFNATYHDAWRYRDYLIDSFDRNRPLDEMIRQQVAGDLLAAGSDAERHDNLVATTFLMLGPKMLSERDKSKLTLDVVDEQIDTVGRAFLAMTLGCARCHDHKFDPIATEDYYALAGIFKSTQTLNGESQKYVSTFNRTELPVPRSHRQAIADYETELEALEKALKAAKAEHKQASLAQPKGIVIDDTQATKTGRWVDSTYSKDFIGSGYVHDDNTNKGECQIEFRTRLPKPGRYTVRFAFAGSGNRADNVPVKITTASGSETITVSQRKVSPTPPWTSLGTYDFSVDKDTVVTIRNDDTDGYVIADAIQFIAVEQSNAEAADSQRQQELADKLAAATAKIKSIEGQIKTLKESAPPPIPVAMAPRDLPNDKIADSPVHIRGEVRNTGSVVPRGFLRVCSPGDAVIESPQGSGRLELARWLTDPDNPLVARVMVNRIWMYLMGEGIVRTVDNFGSRGERPSHPELLDALAIDLMRGGWRLKPMIRQIVLSETYARSSEFNRVAAANDPENRLLWRAHRKRLTAESIRDAMLVASGTLTGDEPTAPVADKGVLVTKNTASTGTVTAGIDAPVRSIYLPVIRGYIAPLLSALDVANPDLLVGQRPTTNVPGQALVLINSEHVNGWAERTAERVITDNPVRGDQIDAAYRICLAREPNGRDRALTEHYLDGFDQATDAEAKRRLVDLVAALFACTEFRLLD